MFDLEQRGMDSLDQLPDYTVTLRYTEPDPITGRHDVAQEVTFPVPYADSPERAAWLAKVRLRLAHVGTEIRIYHWEM